MDQRTNIKDAFHKITAALSPKKRAELADEIELVTKLVEPQTNPVSQFWRDPERSARTRANMQAAGKARRTQLRLTWRSTGREEIVDYQEASKLVHRAEMTVRIAVGRGDGTAHFAYDDDVITIQRL